GRSRPSRPARRRTRGRKRESISESRAWVWACLRLDWREASRGRCRGRPLVLADGDDVFGIDRDQAASTPAADAGTRALGLRAAHALYARRRRRCRRQPRANMELNPFAHEFHEDPYPTYRWLRDHAPLYRNEALDFFALSRFRDVLAASYDWETYSSAEGTTVERLDARMFDATPMMIFLDPPPHDRLRKLVSRAFTPRRVAELEAFARATGDGPLYALS